MLSHTLRVWWEESTQACPLLVEVGQSVSEGGEGAAPVIGLPIHIPGPRQPHLVWAAWPWDSLVLRPWSGTFHWLRGVWGTGPYARWFPLATSTDMRGLGSEAEGQPASTWEGLARPSVPCSKALTIPRPPADSRLFAPPLPPCGLAADSFLIRGFPQFPVKGGDEPSDHWAMPPTFHPPLNTCSTHASQATGYRLSWIRGFPRPGCAAPWALASLA